jgi:dihydroflavonol-4-reductase
MKILVTGANGFLGHHVISQLLLRGHNVKAMMRSERNFNKVNGNELEIYHGNICNNSDLEKAVKDCTHVIHIAADVGQSYPNKSDYYPVNVFATKMLLENAILANCKQFIFISSSNTIGFGNIRNPGNEIFLPSELFKKSGYAYSKMYAENIVLQPGYINSIKITILNPSFLLGPYDYNPKSGRIFNQLLNKRLIFCPPGGKSIIDVRDAAKAIAKSLNKGRSGERYLITGTNISYKDFFRKVIKLSARKALILPVPGFLIKLAGLLGSLFQKIGLKTELNLTNARIICIGNYYTNNKAKLELELSCRNIDETINDYLNWKKA